MPAFYFFEKVCGSSQFCSLFLMSTVGACLFFSVDKLIFGEVSNSWKTTDWK